LKVAREKVVMTAQGTRQWQRWWLGLVILSGFSLGLRLWGLGQINTLVFDEAYYVPFALNYLNQVPSFDAHPPVGKYAIALGIGLTRNLAPWLHWSTILVQGERISPLSFRWLNAVVGAMVPGITAMLAWQLSAAYPLGRRVAFALGTALLLSLEGLTLVESRLGLINIYGLWLGLVGQCCWVRGVGAAANPIKGASPGGGWLWWGAAGIALGAAMGVKWNFAGFWLAIALLTLLRWQPHPERPFLLGWGKRLLCLGVIPMITYGLLWWPHLALSHQSFLASHRQLWHYHQSLGLGSVVHPYCSPWYTWPLLLRPVAYFYQMVGAAPPASLLDPVEPPAIYTLHGLGNPVLWWLSTAAMVALVLSYGARVVAKGGDPLAMDSPAPPQAQPVASFILVNYAAHWLPWMAVGRCTFLYHALSLVGVGALALGWLLSRWLLTPRHRWLGWLLLGAIALGFWFWLPLYLGLPLTPEALQRRWLLPSWI
jgi:dolichyl-phosphate-mannose-protein mannosyltransferase